MNAWIATHGSTVAFLLMLAGMIAALNPTAICALGISAGLCNFVGYIVAGAGGLLKLYQSFTGTTSASATPPPA